MIEQNERHKCRTIVRALRIANWVILITIAIFVAAQFSVVAGSDAAWEYRMAIRGIGSTSASSAFFRLLSDTNMLQALFGDCFMCLWWFWCRRFGRSDNSPTKRRPPGPPPPTEQVELMEDKAL